METFSALLALCAGNLPVTGDFPSQRPVTQNFDILFNLRLNKLNEDLNLPLIDSDPDVQFYNSQCNNSLHSCDYYLEDSFNNKVSDLNLSTGCLSMVHMNIRSIVKNLNESDIT